MDYILEIQFNVKDVILFVLTAESRMLALILVEDHRRSGNLPSDFSNLISATVFSLGRKHLKNEKMKELFSCVAMSLIENNPLTDHKIDLVFDQGLRDAYGASNDDYIGFINRVLSLTERYHDRVIVKVEERNHLNQRLIDQDGNTIE